MSMNRNKNIKSSGGHFRWCLPPQDMRFWLPAAPSPTALSLLLLANQELHRTGEAAPPPEALHLLQWHVAGE